MHAHPRLPDSENYHVFKADAQLEGVSTHTLTWENGDKLSIIYARNPVLVRPLPIQTKHDPRLIPRLVGLKDICNAPSVTKSKPPLATIIILPGDLFFRPFSFSFLLLFFIYYFNSFFYFLPFSFFNFPVSPHCPCSTHYYSDLILT